MRLTNDKPTLELTMNEFKTISKLMAIIEEKDIDNDYAMDFLYELWQNDYAIEKEKNYSKLPLFNIKIVE